MDRVNIEKRINSLHSDFKNAFKINEDNLFKIIQGNKDTLYGKKYDFKNISTVDEYSKKVPLTYYDAYRNKIANTEDFTIYPIYDLLVSSGTTGEQKIFPLTKESLERYSSYINDYPLYLKDINGKILHLSALSTSIDKNSILSSTYYHWLVEKGLIDYEDYVGGKDFLFLEKINNMHYIKAWLLFSDLNLGCIQSIYLYEISIFFKWLENNWRTVLNDIKNNKISIDLDNDIKEKLLNYVPSSNNVEIIEKELSKGFNTPFVPRLYKNIKFVSGIGGSLYSIQEKQLEKYIGDIPKYEFAYALSECMVGIALEFNKAEYALIPNSAYYEFISLKDEEIVSIKDLKVNETYEIIFTTFSGLYRYRSGDLIKIVRYESNAPVFKVVGKRELIIDIAGEKLSIPVAMDAIERLSSTMNIDTHDFAFGINENIVPYGYHVFIESDIVKNDDINDILDNILCEASIDYKDLRNLELLSKPLIHFIKIGTLGDTINDQNSLKHKKPQIFLNDKTTKYLLDKLK